MHEQAADVEIVAHRYTDLCGAAEWQLPCQDQDQGAGNGDEPQQHGHADVQVHGGVDQAQWVWPVAASTVSTMHIIVQHAVDEGAKTFGLVYDNQYKFGVEGAAAYKGAIERLGMTLVKSQGLEPGKTSYTTEANEFNNACGDNEALRLRVERQCGYKNLKFLRSIQVVDSVAGFGRGTGGTNSDFGFHWFAGV